MNDSTNEMEARLVDSSGACDSCDINSLLTRNKHCNRRQLPVPANIAAYSFGQRLANVSFRVRRAFFVAQWRLNWSETEVLAVQGIG